MSAGISLPAEPGQKDERDDALGRTERRLLRKRASAHAPATSATPWDTGFLQLEDVARFRQADAARRQQTLAVASRQLLAESWGIETTGIAFCARMVLHAESLEEQRVFSLIGADEAMHSCLLEAWLPHEDRAPDAFTRFIGGLCEAGNPQPLAFLLQVVLEGFGIVHYTGLAESCKEAALAATLKRMAQDEALHHTAGLAAFRSDRLTDTDRRFLADGAHAFLQMMRSGPQGVAAAVDQAIGIRDEADAARLFEELDPAHAAGAKLERMRRLMAQPGMEWLIGELERGGMFAPCSAAECARIYIGMR